MASKKRSRAPRKLENQDGAYCGYAAIFSHNSPSDHVVYIGGEAYGDIHQIHLTKKQLLRLAPWIAKAAAWAKGRS